MTKEKRNSDRLLSVKLSCIQFQQPAKWVAVQNTPCQEGNETFQGSLTTLAAIWEDHCSVI